MPRTKVAPTQARLKELFDYDPKVGVFIRRVTVGRYKAGTVAGTPLNGYVYLMADGYITGAHRLAWLYVYGVLPSGDLDHKNRNRSDNRISNLRPCTDAKNAKNAKLRKTSKSGYKGVSWKSQAGKWIVQIQVDKVKKHVGYFHDLLRAAKAYDAAAKKLFGEFAALNFEVK